MADIRYSFLSAPDLPNGDVGDARKSPLWKNGMPNSWNDAWDANMKNIFGQLASYPVQDYLVAGDLVDGHWYLDKKKVKVFGKPGNVPSTIMRAGNLYYSEWKRFWTDAGVDMDRVHVAVGDHEVGDNAAKAGTDKYKLFYDFKRVFWENFNFYDGVYKYDMHPTGTDFDKTAFAKWLAPGVLMITVDCFYKGTDIVKVQVVGGQLAWLEEVLNTTTESDFVIVQSHCPVLMPVRSVASGRMNYEKNHNSDFWKLLKAKKVDLYIAGEVHADTAKQYGDGTPLQISHGGLGAYGAVKFMVGDVYTDGTVKFTSYRIDKDKEKSSPKEGRRLWSVDRTIPWRNVLNPYADVTGTLTLAPGRIVTESSGNLLMETEAANGGSGGTDLCVPGRGQDFDTDGEEY